MTKDEIRIACAEACGWKRREHRKNPNCWTAPDGRFVRTYHDLPNYPEDLNACHEMEKALTPDQQYNYGELLASLVRKPELEAAKREGQDEDDQFPLNGFGHFALATIPAIQRCEAFLRTIGKWKE